MKLIIAGSRTINICTDTINTLVKHFDISPQMVVSGGAKGIDKTGERYGHLIGAIVDINIPDWFMKGKAAGPIRNRLMAQKADALLLIWDGESRGSKNMKEEMQKLNKPVYEVILKRP